MVIVQSDKVVDTRLNRVLKQSMKKCITKYDKYINDYEFLSNICTKCENKSFTVL